MDPKDLRKIFERAFDWCAFELNWKNCLAPTASRSGDDHNSDDVSALPCNNPRINHKKFHSFLLFVFFTIDKTPMAAVTPCSADMWKVMVDPAEERGGLIHSARWADVDWCRTCQIGTEKPPNNGPFHLTPSVSGPLRFPPKALTKRNNFWGGF